MQDNAKDMMLPNEKNANMLDNAIYNAQHC